MKLVIVDCPSRTGELIALLAAQHRITENVMIIEESPKSELDVSFLAAVLKPPVDTVKSDQPFYMGLKKYHKRKK